MKVDWKVTRQIYLNSELTRLINELEKLDADVRADGFQNEQWFLDGQDKLNEISVR